MRAFVETLKQHQYNRNMIKNHCNTKLFQNLSQKYKETIDKLNSSHNTKIFKSIIRISYVLSQKLLKSISKHDM